MHSSSKSLILIVLLALATSVSAQTLRASLRGTVSDPNGAVLPGATIQVYNTDTLEKRTVTSNGDGEYAIPSLPAGSYELTVAASGFDRFPQKLVLQVNQQLRVDLVMQVARVTSAAVDAVILPPTELKKDSGSVGTVIENRQVEGLPLDGRNFYDPNLMREKGFTYYGVGRRS